jgi:ubiquinone biosynthesis protein UbiJ
VIPATPLLAAFNHVLDQAEWARLKLIPFAGRTAHISMPPLAFSFAIDDRGRLAASELTAADVEITLPANTLLLALQGPEQVMKAARINGQVEFADTLGFVLRNLRWDIEEDLSMVVGDIAARRLVGMLNSFAGWQREAANNLAENISEYLIEEKRAVVTAAEFKSFSDELSQVSLSLENTEARLKRLSEKQS